MLVLRDVLAFPAAEVAVMLGTTTVSVKSALQRGRARLGELALAAGQITEPTAPQARAVLDQYIAAFENADAAALERLLTARTPLWRRRRCVPGSPAAGRACHSFAITCWDPPATGACCRRSPTGSLPRAVYTRDQDRNYQPYGICVLTVTGAGIRRISSFGDPRLVTAFGFRPDTARAEDAAPAPPGA